MSHLTVLLSFLILSFLSSCGNNEALTVTQTPSRVTVKEGEMARMQCCWRGNENIERVRVIWNKNNTTDGDIFNTLHKKENTINQTNNKYSLHVSANCSEFNISDLSTNDTGVFICMIIVDIPFKKRSYGAGTELKVEKTNSSAAEPFEPNPLTAILIPLAVVVGALCLCAFLCYWRKKKMMPYPGETSGKVGMVIHEVSHEEGEEIMEGDMALAENEGSNRSSQGSTQWCSVPVYESFDYFAVRTGEDG